MLPVIKTCKISYLNNTNQEIQKKNSAQKAQILHIFKIKKQTIFFKNVSCNN